MSNPVKQRKEGDIVPEGVSCTETIMAYYIYIREGNKKLLIRVTKGELQINSSEIERL